MITIEYIPADGTLLRGTMRGDGVAKVLQLAGAEIPGPGWRFCSSKDAWVPACRVSGPALPLIEGTADRLRAAGFKVQVTIDQDLRTFAQVEADRFRRQEQRVAGLQAKAAQLRILAGKAEAALDALPRYPIGQSIMNTRHTRDLERRQRVETRAVAAEVAAREAEVAAAAAAGTTAARYTPRRVLERIQTLTADRARLVRRRDGNTRTLFTDAAGNRQVEVKAPAGENDVPELTEQLGELDAQIAFWNQVAADQAAGAPVYSPDTIAVGDQIQTCGKWLAVERVNPKSVTVRMGYRTHTVRYPAITDHQATQHTTKEQAATGQAR